MFSAIPLYCRLCSLFSSALAPATLFQLRHIFYRLATKLCCHLMHEFTDFFSTIVPNTRPIFRRIAENIARHLFQTECARMLFECVLTVYVCVLAKLINCVFCTKPDVKEQRRFTSITESIVSTRTHTKSHSPIDCFGQCQTNYQIECSK